MLESHARNSYMLCDSAVLWRNASTILVKFPIDDVNHVKSIACIALACANCSFQFLESNPITSFSWERLLIIKRSGWVPMQWILWRRMAWPVQWIFMSSTVNVLFSSSLCNSSLHRFNTQRIWISLSKVPAVRNDVSRIFFNSSQLQTVDSTLILCNKLLTES